MGKLVHNTDILTPSPYFLSPSPQSHEMDHLYEIRELYYDHVTSRLKKKSVDGDTLLYSHSKKEYQFLERNLEELDRAYQKASKVVKTDAFSYSKPNFYG